MSKENRQLYEETQRRLREITTLYEASQACLSISDKKGLLTAIIKAAAQATNAALGSVMLVDEEKGEYTFGAHYGLSEETIATIEAELHIPLGKGLVGAVVTTGQPVVVADVRTDPRWIPSGTNELMRSFLGVPLVGEDGQPVGALNLAHPDVGAFDEGHARLLSTFATQAAIAIRNAQLYEQAQQEIAERKRAEEALRESEQQYRTTINLMGDAIHIIDADLRFILFNTTFKRWSEELGLETDVIGRRIFDVFPFLPDKVREEYQWVFNTGKTLITEELSKFGDREFITETRKIPVYEGGKVTRVVTVVRDITKRKRAEEALKESEERFRTIVEQSPVSIQIMTPDGWTIQVNRAWEELWGVTRENLRDYNILRDEQLKRLGVMPYIERGFSGEATSIPPVEYDVGEILGKGHKRWVQARIYPVKDERGGIRNVILMHEDITERKRAEQSLRDSEERYRVLYEDNPSMYFTVDAEGTVLSVNQFGAEQLGYTVEELVGQSVLKVFHEDDKEAVQQQLTACLQNFGQVARWEFRKVRKDGSTLWVKEVARAVGGPDGNPVVFIVCEDITVRKRLEEQLRQAQKMEAIGTLAGGIAHDFNNLLTSILGFASVVRLELPADSLLRHDVETIIHSAKRASELTRQLLTFARRSQVEVYPLNLNDVVREVIRLLERTIDKAIVIEPHLSSDLSIVKGNAGQLHQMLLNLCLNARDAMPEGGRLIIETQNVTLSKEKARAELALKADRYILLSVTDTGIGMNTEIQQRLFEPFFTTKEQGRGLGLAMVYGIVHGHGGAIHVYSEPGQGSTFKVYLPVASRPAEDTTPQEAEITKGTETVLVVEDEESVRALLQRILEDGGYTVLLAADGVEATELYAERSAEIDLVVLDIIMPRMGGRETFQRLREINPEIKVLLSSGYSENGQAHDILATGARGFLQKPYDLHRVLRKVREVLDV